MGAFDVFRQTISVRRYGEGAFALGLWQNGPPQDFTIQASVQPATQEDLELLPEGRRMTGAFRLYSDTALRSALENEHNPDIVVINGLDYEVSAVAPWQNGIISHFKSIVTRRDPA